MWKWSHLSHNFPLVSSQTSKGIPWPYYWGENGCFLFVFGPYGSISGVMTLRPLERSTLPPVATHPLALLMVFCMLQLAPTKCSFAVYDVVCLFVYLLIWLHRWLCTSDSRFTRSEPFVMSKFSVPFSFTYIAGFRLDVHTIGYFSLFSS